MDGDGEFRIENEGLWGKWDFKTSRGDDWRP
jgi:hypothetical protein